MCGVYVNDLDYSGIYIWMYIYQKISVVGRILKWPPNIPDSSVQILPRLSIANVGIAGSDVDNVIKASNWLL